MKTTKIKKQKPGWFLNDKEVVLFLETNVQFENFYNNYLNSPRELTDYIFFLEESLLNQLNTNKNLKYTILINTKTK